VRRDRLDIATAYVAPQSELEELLCQILAEALELDVVGIDDDFFGLGGDSLAAERLFVGIEVSTGHRMPLATLYDHPTVRQLAGLLVAGHLQPWSALVKLRGGGTQPALFIVPGIGGEVIGMEPLSRQLEGDRPVYCCHFVGLDAAQAPLRSIEEMARTFLPQIRRLQPSGPYHLLGACFGGLVALEIAKRLHSDRQQVGMLCLADTPFPQAEAAGHRTRVPSVLSFVASRARLYAHELTARPMRTRVSYVLGKVRRMASVVAVGGLPEPVKLELAKRRVIDSNREATRRYVVDEHPRSAVYVRSGGRQAGASPARRATWRKHFPAGLSVYTIECRDSGEMFRAHARELAAIVSTELRAHDPAAFQV
jgi:acetoacetyl-CoA synthetase